MENYRFKTKEEFVSDRLWADKYDLPVGWGTDKKVKCLIGSKIPCYKETGNKMYFGGKGEYIYINEKDILPITPINFQIWN